MAAPKLTESQRRYLADLVAGKSNPAQRSITHFSMIALQKRELVKWEFEPGTCLFGKWVPTDAGRVALAQQ